MRKMSWVGKRAQEGRTRKASATTVRLTPTASPSASEPVPGVGDAQRGIRSRFCGAGPKAAQKRAPSLALTRRSGTPRRAACASAAR